MELIAQGIGNIGSALFGGIPATGAIARTATNIKAGAKSPVSGMIHAVTLLAILMAFAMMLNDLGETDKAAKLNAAILAQVEEGKVVTADIGGTAGTKEFTQAVIARL